MGSPPAPSSRAGGSADPPASEPGSRSAARVLAVLGRFATVQDDLGVSEIAHDTGLGISTTHRLLRTLVDAGYVVQDERSERYRLGPAIVALAQSHYDRSGLEQVRRILGRLAGEVGESVTLLVRDGNEAVQRMQANDTSQALRFRSPDGTRTPINVSAVGKVVVAQEMMSAGLLESIEPFVSATPRSIVDRDALRVELREIRRRGWALLDEERETGVRAVAVAIPTGDDEPSRAGISIQGPAFRLPDERLPELVEALGRTAAELAAVLPPGWA
ncbi:IclR family transcriptional regulator [Patulibacter sp. NPDC049589]|uniref:IclR family transcriptional regulator n=1 Tax=Patulibacter sp. NPDC049589 TaxID=3154731 RepID=UPI0034469D34